jgi:hypothetical protein
MNGVIRELRCRVHTISLYEVRQDVNHEPDVQEIVERRDGGGQTKIQMWLYKNC